MSLAEELGNLGFPPDFVANLQFISIVEVYEFDIGKFVKSNNIKGVSAMMQKKIYKNILDHFINRYGLEKFKPVIESLCSKVEEVLNLTIDDVEEEQFFTKVEVYKQEMKQLKHKIDQRLEQQHQFLQLQKIKNSLQPIFDCGKQFKKLLAQVQRIANRILNEQNIVLKNHKGTLNIAEDIKSVFEKMTKKNTLKICVTGGLKAGKSSFLNSLLIGDDKIEDILPYMPTKCTARITSVSYGKEKEYQVGEGTTPIKINDKKSLSNFQNEINLQGTDRTNSEKIKQVVYLKGPFTLLESGIELVDLPGLNEHPELDMLSEDIVPTCDAVIYLVDPSRDWQQADASIIQKIVKIKPGIPILVVASKMDIYVKNERGAYRSDTVINDSLQKVFEEICKTHLVAANEVETPEGQADKRESDTTQKQYSYLQSSYFKQISVNLYEPKVEEYNANCYRQLQYFLNQSIQSFKEGVFTILNQNIMLLLQLIVGMEKDDEARLKLFEQRGRLFMKAYKVRLVEFVKGELIEFIKTVKSEKMKDFAEEMRTFSIPESEGKGIKILRQKIKEEFEERLFNVLQNNAQTLEQKLIKLKEDALYNAFKRNKMSISKMQLIIKEFEFKSGIQFSLSKMIHPKTLFAKISRVFTDIYHSVFSSTEDAKFAIANQIVKKLQPSIESGYFIEFIDSYLEQLMQEFEKSTKKEFQSNAIKIELDKNTKVEAESRCLNDWMEVQNELWSIIYPNFPISIAKDEKPIGEGGYGKVYFRKYKNVSYAMKYVKVNSATRIDHIREVFLNMVLCSRCSYIVEVYAIHCSEDNQSCYTIMEWCENGNLKNYIETHKSLLNGPKLLNLFQIVLALHELHKNNIAHRDLKPDNILIRQDGSACLSDFGCSKSSLLANATIRGTIGYIDPDILKGKVTNLLQSDIYSLGVVMQDFLTNVREMSNIIKLCKTKVHTTSKLLNELAVMKFGSSLSLLHIATWFDEVEVARELMNFKADPNQIVILQRNHSQYIDGIDDVLDYYLESITTYYDLKIDDDDDKKYEIRNFEEFRLQLYNLYHAVKGLAKAIKLVKFKNLFNATYREGTIDSIDSIMTVKLTCLDVARARHSFVEEFIFEANGKTVVELNKL